MVIPHAAAAAIVSVALAASAALLSQAWSSAPAAPRPPTSAATTSLQLPMDEMVVRAANKAALLQLCRNGLGDPEANAYYQRALAANPSLGEGIGTNCQLTSQGQ